MRYVVLTFFLIGCCCSLPGWGQVGMLSKGNWVKIAVPNEGVYQLTGAQFKAMDSHERLKAYPERYPVNSDSVGIEIVGKHIDDKQYEAVTPAQNESLKWLLGELYRHFSLTGSDVYRHPDVSYKNPGEAKGASW